MAKELKVAVCGATGAVGVQMLACLEERNFPLAELRLLASERSAHKKLKFKGREIPVQVLGPNSLAGLDLALFSAGGSVSKTWAPVAAAAGAIVVDNSSAWRMDPQVPLVVPEVNPQDVAGYKSKGIIANPNCSTIQMVVVLKPLHDLAPIKRVVVSTYQAVSGTGQKAVNELEAQLKAICANKPLPRAIYPHQIALNLIPHIDLFQENGYTKEEMKMVEETRKIMHAPEIMVSATCVRVPVYWGHSEAVNIAFDGEVTVEEARRALGAAPGIKVVDDPPSNSYPMPLTAAGQDLTLVGRIRKDMSQPHGLDLWISADNIRKGAATNAVQIAEILRDNYF